MESLYLGFDLSTQQLKCIVITPKLEVIEELVVDFDRDAKQYQIHKGVLINEGTGEVFAPVRMWLLAIDTILAQIHARIDTSRVKAIGGAGQQHGSVFWDAAGVHALEHLDPNRTLEEQLSFAHPYSPNWQDASTEAECRAFDACLGGGLALAQVTGSKAHHRFTGPQIRRFRTQKPDAYDRTVRISLVSSFLASLFCGCIAPIDIADACGMNLWDIRRGQWDSRLMELAGSDLASRLGSVCTKNTLNPIGPYFVERYGFAPTCIITPFTGDNPATILALPLHAEDAIVSLGTSTTLLMSTAAYEPSEASHLFSHPTDPSLYMFMLCYKNGGLAREKVRDALGGTWEAFDVAASKPTAECCVGIYFPRPEIVPQVEAGTWRFIYDALTKTLSEASWSPAVDARAIIESQLLSIRLRLDGRPLRRIYLVGGGARNAVIARLVGEILGGSEGVYVLDVGANACALGAAYKAAWAAEGTGSFEQFVEQRWQPETCVRQVHHGFQEDVHAQYHTKVEGLSVIEERLLRA